MFKVVFHVEIRTIISHTGTSWDLWWGPVWAGSYWTSSLQYRALVAGARLSRTIGRYDNTPKYDKVAPLVLEYLQESRLYSLVMNRCAETMMLLAVFLERREGIYD